MSDNIVHFKGRQKGTDSNVEKPTTQTEAPVIDMTERRQEIITDERRKVRRTILSSFIGAFIVVPRKGLMKVTLYDMSEDGIAFDVDSKAGQFPLGESVAMRVYLSHNTYFPITIKVQNVRLDQADGVYRHGASFVKGSISDLALHHFVKFIENVSASLQRDAGDHVISGSGTSR